MWKCCIRGLYRKWELLLCAENEFRGKLKDRLSAKRLSKMVGKLVYAKKGEARREFIME